MILFPICLDLLRVCVGVAMISCFAGCGKEGELPDPADGQEPVLQVWPELPVLVEDEHYRYVTHYCEVQNENEGCSGRARNYTMCFDATKRGAWWVAYPLHQVHLGSGRPSPDPWCYDPDLSSACQANVSKGSYAGAYDRGHQIPNADRNADLTEGGMCYQTFYASNSTPQAADLNRHSWAELEKKVRGWVCADTLYVVTGAYWCPECPTTTDKSKNDCPIPDHYFKVVVRTKAGNIRQPGDQLGSYDANRLQAIGFWVANASGQGEAREWVKSVAEIEELTGFTFFPTIPDAVKQQKEPAAWNL